MSPMNHNTNTKKLNNQGFSLVELIIVVAIMAVLVGVLAPQYLKYVEQSRESSDLDNYETMIGAVEIYAASHPEFTGGSITCAKNAATSAADGCATALTDAGITATNVKMVSTKYGTCTVSVALVDGIPVFSFTNADVKTALGR